MNRVMLYGATGYIGRLLASEAAKLIAEGKWNGELVLASRDLPGLQKLGSGLNLPFRVLSLDDRETIVKELRAFDVVINVAGPFGSTALRLAKAALDSDCHYVDIANEPQVHNALDDHGSRAKIMQLAMVCGAGWTSTVSDVLVNKVLARFARKEIQLRNGEDIALLRLAFNPSLHLSQGRARSALHAIRESVAVVKKGAIRYVSIGKLERAFEICEHKQYRTRIASACSVPDTLVAKRSLFRNGKNDCDVESYITLDVSHRIGYEIGAIAAVFTHSPIVRKLISLPLSLLPDGPLDSTRKTLTNRVTVEIESNWRRILLRATLETGDLHEFSARSALEIGTILARRSSRLAGWVSPAMALMAEVQDPVGECMSFRDCTFTEHDKGQLGTRR